MTEFANNNKDIKGHLEGCLLIRASAFPLWRRGPVAQWRPKASPWVGRLGAKWLTGPLYWPGPPSCSHRLSLDVCQFSGLVMDDCIFEAGGSRLGQQGGNSPSAYCLQQRTPDLYMPSGRQLTHVWCSLRSLAWQSDWEWLAGPEWTVMCGSYRGWPRPEPRRMTAPPPC